MPLDNYPTVINNPLFPVNEDLFFETRMEPVYARVKDDTGYIVDPTLNRYVLGPRAGEFSAVYRNDTDDCLGMHKHGSYTLVNNKPFFTGIEEKLTEYFTEDELRGVKVKDSISHSGSSCIREYRFNNIKHVIETDRHSTEVSFRVIGWNCFDGSTKATIVYGNIDAFCTNGLISGQYEATSRKRTSGFFLDSFVQRMDSGLEQYAVEMKKLQRYAETIISMRLAIEFFLTLKTSDRNKERLQQRFAIEAATRGQNLWAVVSTLTNYASHTDGRFPVRDTGSNHEGVTLMTRQAQVNKWLGGKQWDSLCNQAALVA